MLYRKQFMISIKLSTEIMNLIKKISSVKDYFLSAMVDYFL